MSRVGLPGILLEYRQKGCVPEAAGSLLIPHSTLCQGLLPAGWEHGEAVTHHLCPPGQLSRQLISCVLPSSFRQLPAGSSHLAPAGVSYVRGEPCPVLSKGPRLPPHCPCLSSQLPQHQGISSGLLCFARYPRWLQCPLWTYLGFEGLEGAACEAGSSRGFWGT